MSLFFKKSVLFFKKSVLFFKKFVQKEREKKKMGKYENCETLILWFGQGWGGAGLQTLVKLHKLVSNVH